MLLLRTEASRKMKKRLPPETGEDEPEPRKRAARAKGSAGSAPSSKAAKLKKAPNKRSDDDSVEKKPSSDQLNFPGKLMELVNENMAPDYVSWIETAEAISFRTDGFQEHVLDKFFQGLKYDSFVRKLNRW
jgi:HSF-type DNA-binding